ncbi:MAG: FtsB family cell division protein [Oscillospiraceae bacterium]
MKSKKAGGILPKIILAVIAIYALASLISLRGRISEAERQQELLQAQVERQKTENEELRDDIGRKDDPEKIAELARENFGLVSSNETVFYDIG